MLGKALEELSSRTLADIICEATGVEEMSQNVFVQVIYGSPDGVDPDPDPVLDNTSDSTLEPLSHKIRPYLFSPIQIRTLKKLGSIL